MKLICQITDIRALLFIHTLIFLFLIGTPCVIDATEMMLTLTATKDKYVYREPIKLYIELTNVSNRTVRIIEAKRFDNNMKYFYFRIENPSGRIEYRKSQFIIENLIVNVEYEGEPLLPGHSIKSCLYPVKTYEVDEVTTNVKGGAYDFTFSEEGIY